MAISLPTALSAGRRLVAGHFHEGPYYGATRPYGLSEWIFIYTRRGHGRFTHAAGELFTSPKDAVLIAPGTRHDYHTARNAKLWELLWAHFIPDPDWLAFMRWPEVVPGHHLLTITDQRLHRRIVQHMLRLNNIMYAYAYHQEQLGMNALEAALILCAEEHAGDRQVRFDPRVRAAMELLSSRHTQPITMHTLARHCKLSTSRIAHLFTQQVGISPQKFLEQQRIEHAKKMLKMTRRPIARIAELVGYDSQFYFARRFKIATGSSPSEYREQVWAQQPAQP